MKKNGWILINIYAKQVIYIYQSYVMTVNIDKEIPISEESDSEDDELDPLHLIPGITDTIDVIVF